MKGLAKYLIPNVGTLMIVGILFFAQAAGAIPSLPQQAGGPSATMISYQGQLTDSTGNPIIGDVNMAFRLYHEASGGTAFWTEEHTGANAVSVAEGLFHLLLGSITPIDASQLTGDIYLGITVGGDEEMTPRELLTSVYHALEATGIAGDLDMKGYDIGSVANLTIDGGVGIGTASTDWGKVQIETGAVPLAFRETDQTGAGSLWRMPLDGTKLRFDVSQNGTDFAGYKTPLRMGPTGNVSIGGNLSIGGDLDMNSHDIAAIGTIHPGGSTLNLGGNLNMNNHSIVNCGALVEANLQTPEELVAEHVERFEQGDLLCWDDEQLEKCSIRNDPLVQAVADENGKPIVIGAEVVKVLGPVRNGDLLVASGVAGYAMADNDPLPGTVIAQALEDLEEEQGLVKAMIRKF